MPLTASDVANKQFTTVKLREGYNMEEVDGFLDEVEGELGRLHREIDDLTAQTAAAPPAVLAPPAPVEVVAPVVVAAAPPTDAAVRMLELAQKTADEYVAGAKVEADRILADARSTHARTMGDLESERTGIQAKVDELRAFEKEYRTRLRSYLEGQLRDLEAKAATPTVAAVAAAPAPQSTGPQAAPPQTAPLQAAPPQAGPPQAPRPFTPAPAPEAPSGPPVQAD